MENTEQDTTFADFDLAFEASAGLPDPEPKEEGFTDPPADPPETPPVEPLAPPVPPPADPPVDPPVVPEPPAAPPAPTVDEIAAKAAAKLAADAQAKADKDAADVAVKAAADDAAARAGKENVSADEQAILDTLEANFPEVSAANVVLSRVIMAKVENMVEQRVNAVLAQLAPIAAVTQNVARNAHEQAILAKHPDAFTMLPQVEAWVDTQPKVLKAAWNKVLDNGSTDDIIELYDVFKKDTGSAQTPGSPGAAPDAAAAKAAAAAAEAAAKEAKLKAQEGIKSRQTTQQSGIDEDDFEGAFNQAARA